MTHKSPMPDNPMLQRNKCQLPFQKQGPSNMISQARSLFTRMIRPFCVFYYILPEEHLFKLAMCIHFQLIAKVF